ncbi:MAG: hypothetical protein GF401_08230 [Chitinivibrionales bacterium]|nr:hypothetical protein [Chitinivibrionales bacterium]
MKNSRKSRGEQVFAGEVDSVLADKIVSHAKKSAGNGRGNAAGAAEKAKKERHGNLGMLLLLAGALGIVSFFIYTVAKRICKK